MKQSKKKQQQPKGGSAPSIFRPLIFMCIGCLLMYSSLSVGSLQLQQTQTTHAKSSCQTSSTATEVGDQFNLAYTDSYGYFDTIPNDSWIRTRQWARNFGFHRYVGNPGQFYKQTAVWFLYNYDPYLSCPEQHRIGHIGDGPKWTCNVHRLPQMAEDRWLQEQQQQQRSEETDEGYDLPSTTAGGAVAKYSDEPVDEFGNTKYGCLIYSIGSNGNYEWEDGLFKELGGPVCEIHIFDYSKNYDRPTNKERNMHFHQWGYKGSKTPDDQLPQKSKDKFVDLFEIIKRLGHEDRVIDIFKIDCEGCEWSSYYDYVPYRNIRQVLVETHLLPAKVDKALEYFDAYAKHDLVMYSKEVNPWGGGKHYEFAYMRFRPEFLHPKSPA